MGRDSALAGADWLLTASDKALVTLRAFKVLRVNVRSLFWRDAVPQCGHGALIVRSELSVTPVRA
jgi:hypothetical protein